jgi:hypothetical protein
MEAGRSLESRDLRVAWGNIARPQSQKQNEGPSEVAHACTWGEEIRRNQAWGQPWQKVIETSPISTNKFGVMAPCL